MTKSSIYCKMNRDAAQFSETCLFIRARIIEAAETMINIDVSGAYPSQMRSFWPEYKDQIIGGHSIGYNNNRPRDRYHPDSKAISRAEEVFYKWFPTVSDDHRPLLCAWAFCLGARKKFGSFGRYCEKNCLSRRTADNQITEIIQYLTTNICKNVQSLNHPNWSRVVTLMPNSRIQIDKMATVTYWMAEDAKPTAQPPQPD